MHIDGICGLQATEYCAHSKLNAGSACPFWEFRAYLLAMVPGLLALFAGLWAKGTLMALWRHAGLICALMLSGCAAFDGYPRRATDPQTDLQTLASQTDASAITVCLKLPTSACRNRVIGARIYATDIQFSQFEETLFRDARSAGFGATLTTLGMTTAASLSTGGTAQVLAGLSALVIGGREAFQKEVLAERTVIAIHTAMRSNRAQVALRLRAGLGQSITQYPFELALSDLNDYYSAGTVLGALVGITDAVGATAQKAESELRTQFRFNLDAPALKFEQMVCKGEAGCPNPDTNAFPLIKNCWPLVGVPADTKMTDFILQEKFTRERGLVAICLKL